MLTPGEVERLTHFLRITSSSSLLDYLAVDVDTPLEECQRRVDERRRWAQAQQANPRYRDESLWLLRNGPFFERLLVDQQESYRQLIEEGDQAEAPPTEETHQPEVFPDHYGTLGLGPSATREEIESAHRSRYRWARTLRDREKAEQLYDQLAAAWNTLSSPSKRAAYDVAYRTHVGLGPEWEDDTGVEKRALALLGPPQSESLPEPQAPPSEPPLESRTRLRRRVPGEPKSRMIVRGRWPRRVHVGRSVSRVMFDVQLGGPAPIWVSVSSSREWLKSSTERFLLEEGGRRLKLTIDPQQMERSRGSGRLVLEAANGERLDLVVVASKGFYSFRRLASLLGTLLVFLGLGHITGLLPMEVFLGPPEAPVASASARLQVFCDPGADSIWIDEVQVGSECPLTLGPRVPKGRSFRLEARLDGFQSKSQTLSVGKMQHRVVRMTLDLAEPLDFEPHRSMRTPTDAPAVAQAALKAIHSADASIQQCMNTAFSPQSRPELNALIYLAAEGHVSGVQFQEPNLSGSLTAGCIQRKLRAVRTPVFDGDFVEVQYHLSGPSSSEETTP